MRVFLFSLTFEGRILQNPQHHNVNLILTVNYSTRVLNESKQLTNDLRRNRDYYGAGDIFTQRNIDLCNQYLQMMESYTVKDLKRVSDTIRSFLRISCHFLNLGFDIYTMIAESQGFPSGAHLAQLEAPILPGRA